ncbi:MAG: hypothetical protein K8J08_16025 [Thermoanaerobaculia bacterium]|nr:hypothetical protein [Thermoanaerobaculia bacterium]
MKLRAGSASSSSRVVQWLLTVGFLLGISLPMVDSFLNLDPAPDLLELRTLAPFPRGPWRLSTLPDLPEKLEDFADDHFGFRNSLVRLDSRLRLLLDSDPYDSKVTLGKSGWLYLNNGGWMDDYRGSDPFTNQELEEFRRRLVERRDVVTALGSRYVLVIAPDKHTIYPEFVSDRYRPISPNRLEQTLHLLQTTTDVEIVDLRQPLRSAKSKGLLYEPTGSHWNDLGAYFASVAIQEQMIARGLSTPMKRLSAYNVVRGQERGSDLARVLGLGDQLSQPRISLEPRRQIRARLTFDGILLKPRARRTGPRIPVEDSQRFAYQGTDHYLPRAVLFRDSFARALLPFMADHYERIGVYWMALRPSVVRHEQPDVVIEEMAERFFIQLKWLRTPLIEELPSPSGIFSNGFEEGDTSQWTLEDD